MLCCDQGDYDDILNRGDFRPRRLNLKRGDCWVQDIRTLHRGTANNSEHVRPEVVINCAPHPPTSVLVGTRTATLSCLSEALAAQTTEAGGALGIGSPEPDACHQ